MRRLTFDEGLIVLGAAICVLMMFVTYVMTIQLRGVDIDKVRTAYENCTYGVKTYYLDGDFVCRTEPDPRDSQR